jgi:UDP-arabinose 4-epimerase
LKILVTGGAGYIGSHTCKRLAEAGHEPIVFDNLSTGHHDYVRFGPFVHGDLNDQHAIQQAIAAHRPEAIIHFAASAYVGESMHDPLKYYRNNVSGMVNLLNAATLLGVGKIVFSSSCATYGVPDQLPIVETSPQRPINPYGETKLIGEQMLRATANAGKIEAMALRYFNAAGAAMDGTLGEAHDPETHAIPLRLAAATDKGGQFGILGDDYPTPDGTCVRDYLHVDDLAEAHLQAVQRLTGTPGFDAVNLGTGTGVSVRELVDAAREVTGKAIQAEVKPRRPGDPPVVVADARKAKAVLEWEPRHSDLQTILTTAWGWMNSPRNPLNHSH